jgi:hypothetical protein
MTSLVGRLSIFLRFSQASGGIQVVEPDRHEQTVATGVIVPAVPIQEYKSILPLAGKYANAPFLKNMQEILDRYDQEIENLNKE